MILAIKTKVLKRILTEAIIEEMNRAPTWADVQKIIVREVKKLDGSMR